MRDPQGNPGKLWRDCDSLLGILRNGSLPVEVSDSNLESEHAAEFCLAVEREGGFVMSEAPARRTGSKAHPRHVLPDCTRAVHMFDHPSWATFAPVTQAVELL
jgi:hypothetical protein